MEEINSGEVVLTNPDLLVQILTRVPPASLVTFRFVSKQWLSLISDPHFLVSQRHHHLATHPPSSTSRFYYRNIPISISRGEEGTNTFPKLDIPEVVSPIGSQLRIISACNGLILCQYGSNKPFIVFNPTTQKHRLLPEPMDFGYHRGYFTVLAYDPLTSFHYKIVRFRSPHYPDRKAKIDIFSSESGEWKQIHLQDPCDCVVCYTRMIFWNGAIHWMAKPNFHIRFIVDEEKFIRDQIPTDLDTFPNQDLFGYFGKSDNGLLLIKLSSGIFYQGRNIDDTDRTDEVFTVIEMDKDCRWFPKHLVDLKPLVSKYLGLNWVPKDSSERLKYNVLYVKSGNNKEVFSMVLAIAKKIILYEVGKGNGGADSKVLCEFPYDCWLGSYSDMNPYIEILAPVF